MRAQVVVDASGQSGLLQHKFKLRVWDPILNKGAIWTYWEGAYRDTGKDEGATIVLQTANRQGWFWYIPLHDNRVSVGVVAPFDYLFKGRDQPRADLPGRSGAMSGDQGTGCQRAPRDRLFCDQRLLLSRHPGGWGWLGAWSATPSASSILCTPRAYCWL